MIRFKLLCLFCLFFPILADGQLIKSETISISSKAIEWKFSELIRSKNVGICIDGDPQLIDCKFGKAILFNGSTDGLFLNQMPLKGLEQFTIEAIIKPDSGGKFEQRFFHCGEIRGDRVLLELRSIQTNWYLDAFIKSGDQQKTLIDSTKLHPLNQWFHIAFVNDHGKLTTFINGKWELESLIDLVPLLGGATSIGVRQNEQSWFKGAIYKIRISPMALNPADFLNH